jgi:hypothetical protein
MVFLLTYILPAIDATSLFSVDIPYILLMDLTGHAALQGVQLWFYCGVCICIVLASNSQPGGGFFSIETFTA